MRIWLVQALTRILTGLLHRLAPEAPYPLASVFAAAQHVVMDTEKLPHTPHYKRALAMKALRQMCPRATRTRDLALAIELAVRASLP